jgi:hypothetical protein
MRRIVSLLIISLVLFASCKKTESDFLWEKSYGKGEALFLNALSDSGLIACGQVGDKPYLIRLDKTRRLELELKSETSGLFSSAWSDTSGYISGGSTEGKMLLMRHSKEGNKLWEKSIAASFKIDFTNLYYTGNGNLLAIGTAIPDSSESGATGILFVRFDTTGVLITENELAETDFISATGADIDNAGNIYLALTRKKAGSKSKASVAKFNDLFQKLWETELYNNPNFGAASTAIILDESDNVYVAGRTELATEDGTLNNSFMASLSNMGSVFWKKYLENSNTGVALTIDDNNNILMLNTNCYIISMLSLTDGADAGRIRMFSLCDSYNTDALGAAIEINYDENILVAGKRGGSFYLGLKTKQ